jgi:hypothetical protein
VGRAAGQRGSGAADHGLSCGEPLAGVTVGLEIIGGIVIAIVAVLYLINRFSKRNR